MEEPESGPLSQPPLGSGRCSPCAQQRALSSTAQSAAVSQSLRPRSRLALRGEPSQSAGRQVTRAVKDFRYTEAIELNSSSFERGSEVCAIHDRGRGGERFLGGLGVVAAGN